MNSRELKTAYRIYDLLSTNQLTDILTNVEDIEVRISNDMSEDEGLLFRSSPNVVIRHTKSGVRMVSTVVESAAVNTLDLLDLDTLENRLAFLTIEHLKEIHND